MTLFWLILSPFLVVGGGWAWFVTPPRGWPKPGRPTTPNHPLATRHEQCLTAIDVLERQLADDGVLFLQGEAAFDREVDRASQKVQQAKQVREMRSITQSTRESPFCPVSGERYSLCSARKYGQACLCGH